MNCRAISTHSNSNSTGTTQCELPRCVRRISSNLLSDNNRVADTDWTITIGIQWKFVVYIICCFGHSWMQIWAVDWIFGQQHCLFDLSTCIDSLCLLWCVASWFWHLVLMQLLVRYVHSDVENRVRWCRFQFEAFDETFLILSIIGLILGFSKVFVKATAFNNLTLFYCLPQCKLNSISEKFWFLDVSCDTCSTMKTIIRICSLLFVE